jgi:glycerophosphoryl diester phosphodiesterase
MRLVFLVMGLSLGMGWTTQLEARYAVEHVPDGFVLQTHRGAGVLGPENTFESFQFAWRLGTIPEADIRTSKDGVIVAFHDKDFKRVVEGVDPETAEKGVEDLAYEELKKLDVGVWRGEYFRGQRIPMMATVFAAMSGHPERRLYLDIKDVSLEKLAQMLRNFGVEKQVILASTHYDLIRRWKELLPESQTLLWMGGDEETLVKRMEEVRKENFAGITQLQIHARITDLEADDPFTPSSDFFRRTGEELREHGILFQSLPWGTSDPRAYEMLLDLGVEAFATDYPQQTLQIVSDYFEGRGK